jgi:hypothetical protein
VRTRSDRARVSFEVAGGPQLLGVEPQQHRSTGPFPALKSS